MEVVQQISIFESTPGPDPAEFDGETYVPETDGPRLFRQLSRVYDVMSDGEWRTLAEIAALTGDPQASVSARLRDFRKPKFGAYDVPRRRRGAVTSGLFEWRLGEKGAAAPAPPHRVSVIAQDTAAFKRALVAAESLLRYTEHSTKCVIWELDGGRPCNCGLAIVRMTFQAWKKEALDGVRPAR